MKELKIIRGGEKLLSENPLLLAVVLAPLVAWLNPLFTAMLTKSVPMTQWATGLSVSVTVLAVFMALFIFVKQKGVEMRYVAGLALLANMAFVIKAFI